MSAIHLPYIQTDIQPDTCHTLAAAVVPIRGFFRGAGIGNSEPLLQVFSLVAGGRVKIQKRGSCEVTTGT
jgi:hypothetical protein